MPEALCVSSNRQAEVTVISLLHLSLIARHQYLMGGVNISYVNFHHNSFNIPVLLSTNTSLSINVISLSDADVVDVWSSSKFHFSFCRRFRWIGIFLRYVCDTSEAPDISTLSLLILIKPMSRNDHTANMNKNLKKFFWTLFMSPSFVDDRVGTRSTAKRDNERGHKISNPSHMPKSHF